jgi:NAD(P)-dependent dehydrogenase (short-subunit alcohol dehydrogenase family)
MTVSSNKKIALVTGAGSGIGRATAMRLLADGFSVVLAGRRREPLGELAESARAAGQEALAVTTDVRDPASVDALFEKIEGTYGRLDVLFNNARRADGRVARRDMEESDRYQRDRRISLRARRLWTDETAVAPGRPHYQQWFYLSAHTAPLHVALYREQTRRAWAH